MEPNYICSPLTDKVAREIGRILAKYAAKEIKLAECAAEMDKALDVLREIEHNLKSW